MDGNATNGSASSDVATNGSASVSASDAAGSSAAGIEIDYSSVDRDVVWDMYVRTHWLVISERDEQICQLRRTDQAGAAIAMAAAATAMASADPDVSNVPPASITSARGAT